MVTNLNVIFLVSCMIVDKSHIKISFAPSHAQQVEEFFKVYDMVGFEFATIKEKEGLIESSKRICRFCGLTYPKVKFDKLAHTIPEFLGNKCSVSDFECDTCNKHFGKLEQQLSNFIGVAITLNRTKGKKKIPSSPSSDKKIIAQKVNFLHAKTAIEFGSTENNPEKITFNEATNAYNVEFATQPYIPFDVYKSFLKIAVGMMPEEDLKNFELARKLLQDIRNKQFSKTQLPVLYIHHLSKPYKYTGAFLFKRKDPLGNQPPFSLVLFYGQLMYQIYIPFSVSYLRAIHGKTIDVPLLPPISPCENWDHKFMLETVSLDSVEPTTRKQTVTIAPNDTNIERVAIDGNSGKLVKGYIYNPHNIVKFMFIEDDGFSISLPNDE